MMPTAAGLPAALILLSAPLGACRSEPEPPQTHGPAPMQLEPLVAGAHSGLEVHWWLTHDDEDQVAQLLTAYADPALPRDPVLRDRWSAAGLRLVRAPVDQFPQLHQSLPATHMRHQRWVGWTPSWTEIFRGRRAGGVAPLIADGERRSFRSGVLRLLLRCWPELEISDDGANVVRLELAIQIHVPDRETVDTAFQGPRIVPPEEQGEVFRSLTLETTVEQGYIYILTAASPGAQPAGPGTVSANGDGQAPDAGSAPPSDASPFGPIAADSLTVGQAMLTASAAETRVGRATVVLVMLPFAPREYRLIPRRNQ